LLVAAAAVLMAGDGSPSLVRATRTIYVYTPPIALRVLIVNGLQKFNGQLIN
jgi:hypothetical protein